MFKKGVITDEISQNLKCAVDLALKYQLDGIEIRSIWEKGPHELSQADIANIKKILADTPLEVCAISAPFYKCELDNDSEIKEHIEILKRCIELANNLNTKIIRGFTFWKRGDFNSNFDRIISKFKEPIELLKKDRMTMALEFDPSVYATNARTLKRVVEALDTPWVKALWDPGNDIYDPEGEVPFPDGYNIIKDHIVHVHLKDAKKLQDGKIAGTPIGEGQVDYVSQFKELISSNYNGYVVMETHYRPKHDIGEELLALPKGSAFSYMGYEATEECLIKWEEILKDIKSGKKS